MLGERRRQWRAPDGVRAVGARTTRQPTDEAVRQPWMKKWTVNLVDQEL
jgi:hypothetical protein